MQCQFLVEALDWSTLDLSNFPEVDWLELSPHEVSIGATSAAGFWASGWAIRKLLLISSLGLGILMGSNSIQDADDVAIVMGC